MKDNGFDILGFIIKVLAVYILFTLFWGSSKIKINNDLNSNKYWEKAVLKEKPIFVYFYGNYCSVCHEFKPLVYNIANEYNYKITFLPVNVEDAENNELQKRFKVNVVPTIYIVNTKTAKYERFKLVNDKEYFRAKINNFISKT
jgi:thiol-disulfide isomerase/thioredoxin